MVKDDIRNNDEELDAKQAAMVAKLRRLVSVSTAIMLVGFLSVMSIIAYRLVKTGPAPQGRVEQSLGLAADERIASVNGDGRNIYIVVTESTGDQRLHILDAGTFDQRGIIRR